MSSEKRVNGPEVAFLGVLILLSGVSVAFAAPCTNVTDAGPVGVDQLKVISSLPRAEAPVGCISIDLRAAPVGTKCTTSNGSVYERVSRDKFGEAWKGPDGVIWSDRVGENSQYYAVDTCKNLGGELPSKADFERGEANGLREVLPNMKDYCFWSSSVRPVRPGGSDNAYSFLGLNGGIDYDPRNAVNSVRCIGR